MAKNIEYLVSNIVSMILHIQFDSAIPLYFSLLLSDPLLSLGIDTSRKI